ncbi:MAG: tyrosine-type recombinase/integrase [Niameybacter sp.]
MHKEYKYSSVFGALITSYISERRMAGFMFDNPAYWLYRFDQFCVERKVTEAFITKDLFDLWSILSPTESKTTQNNRLTALRCFSVYLNTMSISSYIPHKLPKPEKIVPYLMDDQDIQSFFEQVDAYNPLLSVDSFERLAVEYKVLYRLIYCCGLRNSEACSLRVDDVDTINGILTIIHSKGDKDRMVYLSEDMCFLCYNYLQWLKDRISSQLEWFFPGRNPKKYIPKTSVDSKFNEFWSGTERSKNCDKKPTVHCLRHAFVIKRMNTWMENDIQLQVMMPYLSHYLGHKGPIETYYYYHQVEQAFTIIRRKDKISSSIIPEVPVE